MTTYNTHNSNSMLRCRYYAVGFAARQLYPDATGLASAASSSSSRHLNLMQRMTAELLAACKLSRTCILRRHSSSSSIEDADAAAAAAAEAVSAMSYDSIHICTAVADALMASQSSLGSGSSSSSSDAASSADVDAFKEHGRHGFSSSSSEEELEELEEDLEDLLGEVHAHGCFVSIIQNQRDHLLLTSGAADSSEGLRDMLACASGAADACSGVAQAALLPPVPVELWLGPAGWCAVRSMLTKGGVCSECEAVAAQGLEGVRLASAWEAVVRAGFRKQVQLLAVMDFCWVWMHAHDGA
jgi:hypothetical protein